MNNPNPLIPQGSLLEQQAKSKPHLRIALFIVAVHVVFLGLLLMQGCKREPEALETVDTATNANEFPFGIPDRNTLYASNPAPTLEMNTAVVTGTNGRDMERGLVERTPETSGFGQLTNLAAVPSEPVTQLAPVRQQLVTREYVVASKDTFTTIGKKFGVTPAAIALANPNVDPKRMAIGQRLIIPPPAAADAGTTGATTAAASLPPGTELYSVKSGDTLTRVAKTHGTTAAAIRQLNGMTTDRIIVGQKLKVPAKTNVAAPTRVNP